METKKITIGIIKSFNKLKNIAEEIHYTKNQKFLYSNYGNWNIKYKRDNIEGFVSKNGEISINGEKIKIEKQNIMARQVKQFPKLFLDIKNMLLDIIENIDNSQIVDRSSKLLKISKREISNSNSRDSSLNFFLRHKK